MKYLVCPDSFKGSLDATEAAEAIAEGLRREDPDAQVTLLPLADGGEGTAAIVGKALGASPVRVVTVDPLRRSIEGGWWRTEIDGCKTAILDVASSSGLALIHRSERNIMTATSFGTGLLIRDALQSGIRDFIIGLGGSATNDGGLGILEALGWQLLDAEGNVLQGNGSALCRLARMIPPYDSSFRESRVRLLCDVRNPFFGKEGAAYVFAPQKGASGDMIEKLDEGLIRLNDLFVKAGGIDVSMCPGAAAAGGIGGMFMSLSRAEMRNGIDEVMDLYGFEEKLKDVDVVITGEGRVDSQTLNGKTLSGIVGKMRNSKARLIGFGGSVEPRAVSVLKSAGFELIHEITPKGQVHAEAMRRETARRNLADAVARWVRTDVPESD